MPCDIVAHDAPTSCQPSPTLVAHSLSFWPHKCFVEIKKSEKISVLVWLMQCINMWPLLDKVGSSGINHP